MPSRNSRQVGPHPHRGGATAGATGATGRYKGFAEQCMAEYNLDGWVAEDLINPDDVSAIIKKNKK